MRRLPVVTALGFGALLSSVPFLPVAGQSITVVSWGGSYARAVNEGANIPFTEATGIRISLEAYNGGLAQIRA
ncbi:MAG: ABC transporter substrate-binding protein, partial [Gemmatimonadota bacterium]|nr:ABC transporter substrate-binding protein [Gemmatimonadota bacterium]